MKTFTFNDRDTDILRAFLIFPWLTPKQVCKLYWADTSLKYVEKRLVWLTLEEKYLKRYKEPSPIYPYFYTLSERGVRLLEERPLFYPARKIHLMHLSHFLMTNEVMIAALKLPNVLDIPTPYYIYHDLTLKHILKVAVPDAFIEFRQGNERIPFCFEIHLQTGEKKFKAKITSIIQSMRSEYREVFKTDAATWVFLTTTEDKLQVIYGWACETLTQLGEEREADLFRFAVIPEKNIDPLELFTRQMFRIPFSEKGFVDALLPPPLGQDWRE